MSFPNSDAAHKQEPGINCRIFIDQPAGKAVGEVLGIIFRIVIMERTFAKARRDARGIERSRPAIRSPAVAYCGALAGIKPCAGAKTEWANDILGPLRLLGVRLWVCNFVQATSERYYVFA